MPEEIQDLEENSNKEEVWEVNRENEYSGRLSRKGSVAVSGKRGKNRTRVRNGLPIKERGKPWEQKKRVNNGRQPGKNDEARKGRVSAQRKGGRKRRDVHLVGEKKEGKKHGCEDQTLCYPG